MSHTTVVYVKWVAESVCVCEGVNRTVALHVVADGVFACPISIGVACSPVIACDVSAGNVLTCVYMHLICTYVHILCMHSELYIRMYSCTCGVLYVCMYVRMYILYILCMFVHLQSIRTLY